LYIDTVSNETSRLRSGHGTFPDFGSGDSNFGEPYAPTYSSLSIGGDVEKVKEELLLQNGQYRYPTGDWSKNWPVTGSNYVSLSGIRWATFNLGNITSASSIILNINGTNNTFGGSKIVSGLHLYVKVIGTSTTGWLNANGAYGTGSPSDNDDYALDASSDETTATKKRITFGSIPRTGNVYVRIGFTNTSFRFTNITMG